MNYVVFELYFNEAILKIKKMLFVKEKKKTQRSYWKFYLPRALSEDKAQGDNAVFPNLCNLILNHM